MKTKKVIPICVCFFMLFAVCSINVGATYNESVTAQFQNTTYMDGKAILQLSVNFPRTEQGKMLVVIFKLAFSQNDQELTWDMIHVDGTGFSDNGKTNATREVYLYGDETHLVNTEHNFNKYCVLRGRPNSAVQIYTKVYPINTENPITFDIPLAISDDVEGDVVVSASTATCEVYNAEGGEMTHSESGSFLITQATISPASAGGEGGNSSTTLEVGENKDITDITNGAATVSGTVTDGKATLNVASDKACVVAYTTDNGATYTRVDAAQADSSYDFVVPNFSESMKFVVAVKGDANGDGAVTNSDVTRLKAIQNGKYQADVIAGLAADVNGDNSLTNSDATRLKAVLNGKASIAW